MVTLEPLTEQIEVVKLENDTESPEEAVALIENEDGEYVRLAKAPNVIDWLALLIAKDRVTDDAAFHVASPDWEAVNWQVPAPRIVIVAPFVPPVVHTVDVELEKVTGSPDDAEALTPKVPLGL